MALPFWTTALLAAGLTIPPLVLLYFLKLRRRQVEVPSTLLWKRTVMDLQVNAPFQKLRRNLLLLLQLLILIALAAALGRPLLNHLAKTQKKAILLVDVSASMRTVEADGRTRLQIAKEEAATAIDNLPDGGEAMVIAFAERAWVAAAFTSDRALLKRQVDALDCTEASSRLGEAVELAEAHMRVRPAEAEGNTLTTPITPIAPADLILLSDTNLGDADQVVVRYSPLQIVRIGQRADNVGITSLDVRRNYEQPELLSVFAAVRNFGPEAVRRDVTLRVNGDIVSVKEIALQPGIAAGRDRSDGSAPGSAGAVSFELTHEAGGRVEVELAGRDALASDDVARAVVEPPRRVDVLLVSEASWFLEKLLASLPLRQVRRITPAQYETLIDKPVAHGGLLAEGRLAAEVAVINQHSTDKLPPGNYLFIDGVPEVPGVARGDEVEGRPIVDWDATHPILRHVVLEYLHVARWRRLTLPDKAVRLIEGATGSDAEGEATSPLMAYFAADGRQYLILSFDLANSNWPLKISFPVFAYNAVRFLGSAVEGASQSVSPGQAIQFRVPGQPNQALKLLGPDDRTDRVQLNRDGLAYFADTDRVGFYSLEVPDVPDPDRPTVAVNLFDANESNVRPRPGLAVAASSVEQTASLQRVNQPVWPWLIGAALAILCFEWYVYNRRVYI